MNTYKVKKRFPFSSEEPEGQGRDQTYLSLNGSWSCLNFFLTYLNYLVRTETAASPSIPVLRESGEQFRAFLSDVFLGT